jgi:ribosome-associated heat shock protein Hsp15
MELRVTGLCTRRVGAKVAAGLYEETAQSAAARVAAAELKRMAWRSTPRPASRPNKRDRRRLIRFVRAAGEGEAAGKGDDEDA